MVISQLLVHIVMVVVLLRQYIWIYYLHFADVVYLHRCKSVSSEEVDNSLLWQNLLMKRQY